MVWTADAHRVAEYSQAQAWGHLLDKLSSSLNAKGGVCQELSAKWVRLVTKAHLMKPSPYPADKRKKMADPHARMVALGMASTMQKAVITHERVGPKFSGEKPGVLSKKPGLLIGKPASLPQDDVNELYGVKAQLDTPYGTSFQQLVTAITSSKSTCFILVMSTPAGKHAVACFTGDEIIQNKRKVHFFDPNYGEYELTGASFQGWFLDYLIHYMHENDPTKFGEVLLFTCERQIVPKGLRKTKSPEVMQHVLLWKELMAQED